MTSIPAPKETLCPECGQLVAEGEPVVLVDDVEYHEECEPPWAA